MNITYPERLKDLNQEITLQMKQCVKKPIPVMAVQINHEFRVETLEGNYKQGKAGDYLMCGIEDELYICDKHIFEKAYEWIK